MAAIGYALITFVLLSLVLKFDYTKAALNYRLSRNVLPKAYDITIKPYLLAEDGDKRFTFLGEVKITLYATVDSVHEITLHKDYLEIESASLYDSNGCLIQNITTTSLVYESETAKLRVNLASPMEPFTNYTLHFKYSGIMRNGTAGLYPVSYIDAGGKVKWIALTQLQRINARTVFPCFDEPAFKARFQMHISRPKHYNSKFNTRLVGSDEDGANDLVMLTRAENVYKTAFATEVAVKALKAYNDYTKLPYKSLGNVLMQETSAPVFPHNGMENWGLVMYKDAVLIHEPGYTDGWSNKEYTLSIIVHETAHMWFGNSVSFAWWSYFWLNEAFARYYQNFLAHEMYPEYQLDQQFVVKQIHFIFGIDAVNTTQPMTSPEADIATPSQIASKFSSITYAKGAAILRMLRNAMGSVNFDNAIQDYLKENHLKSIIPADFFKHLKTHWPAAQQVDLAQFFADWTEQVGFPTLFVNKTTDGRTIILKQQRFLLNPNDGSDANIRYTIPITYATAVEQNFFELTPKMYFNKTDQQMQLHFEQPIDWIVFNLQQANYHRVFYAANILTEIQNALLKNEHSGIHVINRAQLIDDLFNFGRIDLMDYKDVIAFIEYMSTEEEYLPWYAAMAGLKHVAQHLNQTELQYLGRFIGEIGCKIYKKLGFNINNDTVLDVYNRNKIVTWFCKYQQGDCNKKAEVSFNQIVESGEKPIVDFRETLYCNANRRSTVIWSTLYAWYQTETIVSEQEMILRAMGCTVSARNAHYTFILLSVPRDQLTMGVRAMYTSDPENVTPTFDMIVETLEDLQTRLDSWTAVANILSELSNYFTEQKQLLLLEEFVKKKGSIFGSSISILQTAVGNVKINLEWAHTNLPNMLEYLMKRRGQ